ncbi:MAG: AAA family ATPase [Bacteroidales bacterium]|nr:AAA family ATPase [Bacteroidales bacterium]
MATPHKYPTGRADFESIINEGFLYVDKTERMYEMIGSRKFVFFSRPRRFGKSLLVNTLHAYFEGKKELFKGLKISEYEKDWIQYPVIKLDMSAVKDVDIDKISGAIATQLVEYETKYSIPPNEKLDNGSRFYNIIKTAKAQTGRNVVVLIDEYDAPLNAHLYDGKLKDVKPKLQEVYQQLKVLEKDERFVFITGISKFSQVSIFSTINNLEKLSMWDQFSDICGITHDELHRYFKEDIEVLAEKHHCTYEEMMKQLIFQYDCYHFSENSPAMFNPTSIVNAFAEGKLNNHWFGTATSSYIIDHLKRHNADIKRLVPKTLFADDFDVSPEDYDSLWSILYQAGYLTIKGYLPERKQYVLDYPNNEVRVGMMQNMIHYYFYPQNLSSGKNYMTDFYFALKEGQIDEAFTFLKDFLITIPNVLNNKEEKHFQTILYVMFTWLGFYTEVEVNTAVGRTDVVIKNAKNIFVLELKVDGTAEQALAQINSKNYAIPYKYDGREIIKIGVNISSDNNVRTIDKWVVEK